MAQLLKLINKGVDWQQVNRQNHKDGSFGNGAAMRAPIIALCFPNSVQERQEAVKNVPKSPAPH